MIATMRDRLEDVVPWISGKAHLRSATELGERARVYGRPSVQNFGEMVIGDRVQVFSRVAKTEIVCGVDARLVIGSQCLIMDGSMLSAMQSVEIGDRCLFGRQTQILDCDFHFLDPERRFESPPPQPVVIEDNVWLASRVTVLPGVTIGEGAAVAAGAVVSCDVAPRTLVGGIPAREIRSL